MVNEIEVHRTTSDDPDFVRLVRELDAFLAAINGEKHGFFSQHNRSETLAHVVVAYRNGEPVGCGAFRPIDGSGAEIKRMFVMPSERGNGIGGAILQALEDWIAECGYYATRLETSVHLEAAQRLYARCGYTAIPNYGPYVGVDESVCMEKALGGRR